MNRDYFLGGNTSKGFFSYYDYLADAEEINKIYIIKGGPGTGKSTTMKLAGKWGEENEFDVDYIHCSSDPDSLDGLVIKKAGIAMVDGTSPHIVDAKNAGAVETILNMGDFWDEKIIKSQKKEIMECNKEISARFCEAYNFLEAAGSLNRNCQQKLDRKKVIEITENILSDMPLNINEKQGKIRKLFADAITPDGFISFTDSLSSGEKIVLKSEISGGAKDITKFLADKLIEKGYNIEAFYSPLDPENEIRHIFIPEINVSILTSDLFSLVDERNAVVIDVDEITECKMVKTGFLKSKLFTFSMIEEAIRAIASAKKLHDKLESFYIPAIDFSAMEEKRVKIFEEFKEIAQQSN